jgi:sulfate transport system ATP-binding protein
VSFVLEHGSAIAIVGRSGTGKTLLLRALAGLERCAEGHVEIDGESTRHCGEREWNRLRQKLGIVLEESTLLHDLTLEENITFPLIQQRVPEKDIDARLEHSLVSLDIYDWRGAAISDLSPTVIRRGLLARALILEPQILLFDAPFDGLDPDARRDLSGDLARLVERRGVALLATCHDPVQAKELAGTRLSLEQGALVPLR